MAEKKSKGPVRGKKSKSKKVYASDDDDDEDYSSKIYQQERMSPIELTEESELPPMKSLSPVSKVPPRPVEKVARPMKQRKVKSEQYFPEQTQSVPMNRNNQHVDDLLEQFQQLKHQTEAPMQHQQYQTNVVPKAPPLPPAIPPPPPPPLPPITTIENINEIFQTKIRSSSMKEFKNYFLEHAKNTGKIHCDANSVITDAHFYELCQIEWPNLKTIRIRACPQISPFLKNYLDVLCEKNTKQQIDLKIELMNHPLHRMLTPDHSITDTIAKLETIFDKIPTASITKGLIYQFSSLPKLLSQFRKENDTAPMLLDYNISTHNHGQLALLECTHSILSDELYRSFHPHIVYLVIFSADDFFRWFFSVDSNAAFSLLHDQAIRIIVTKTQSVDQFLSFVQKRLSEMSKSAQELYKTCLEDTTEIKSDNDDFRRNHYLSSLLHFQSKCEILMKKLTKDHCFVFNPQDPSSLFNTMTDDAVKYANIVYQLPGTSNESKETEKLIETNVPISNFVSEVLRKGQNDSSSSTLHAATRLSQSFFAHRLLHDKVLDLFSTTDRKSFVVSDINWFCRLLNNLFQSEIQSHRKTEHIIEQIKQTIGSNLHLIFKRNLKKLNLTAEQISFFYWLLNTWNIAYPVPINAHSNMYVLFNSISSEPPIPLETVWSSTWPVTDHQSVFYFHLLHPCPSSILFYLYKLFPSQKILLASRDFLLIQDGAIEVLLRMHQDNPQAPDLSVTCRTVNLISSTDEFDATVGLIKDSFRYLSLAYYVIIWSYLFQHDYAFKVEQQGTGNSFEEINGNALMIDQWDQLALYHYAAAPTLTSPCSVCGLPPSVNKALYNACTILSPARQTAHKSRDSPMFLNDVEIQSNSLLIEHGANAVSYTGRHSLRPDGYNSFEVIFLKKDRDQPAPNESILASLQIGCLLNNREIEDDEQVLFVYGSQNKAPTKRPQLEQKQQEVNIMSHLEAIRNFGGLQGLNRKKTQNQEEKTSQELYPGLRLRIDVFFTSKPNTFELVFSVNGIPSSHQTIKRKSTQTFFQPIVQSQRTDNSKQSIYLLIHHHRSFLDNALIEPLPAKPTKKPWKVGMRLEAKDRKNPSILAIANIIEVYEDNRIRINFDGWTSNFDYTVETDHSDLHPAGYWEYVQRVLYKNIDSSKLTPHFTFNRYDKPKSYDRYFSWRNYLTENDFEPVPLECFNYIQTEGMTIDFFPHGIAKTAFTTLSCRHFCNPRVKYQKMNSIIQDELVQKILFEHDVAGVSASAEASPGAILFPTPIDMSLLNHPCLKQFQTTSEVTIHMTCNHRDKAPWDSSPVVSGGHLLDNLGNPTEKSNLTMSVITLCMLTAVDLARNQNHPIAPCTSKLIANLSKSLDKRLIELHIRRWLELSAYITCFHSTDFYAKRSSFKEFKLRKSMMYASYADPDLFVILKKNLDSVPLNYQATLDSRSDNVFGMHGECYYCSLLRPTASGQVLSLSIEKRLEIIGGYAPSIFYIAFNERELKSSGPHFLFDDQFFTQFNGLEIITLRNVIIDQFQISWKHIDCLKNLKYLALENNDLSTINADFHGLKKLNHLKLMHNPLISLPMNCFSSKSLQTVELTELGRLTDIDPNARFSSELKSFIVTESILTTLPNALGLDARTKLVKLTLSGASWWRPDGMSVNEVIRFDSFNERFSTFLDRDDLIAIYRMYDEDFNGILSFSEINLMNAHIYRYIPRLRSTSSKMPSSGRSSVEPGTASIELDQLKQDSFTSDPSGIPSTIFSLDNLTELTLDYQGIKIVPDAIKNLKALTIFNLNYCIELETISAQVGFLPLKELNLNGCISLKTPPTEIIRRGHTQTMAFLQRLISGSTACKRTKLMLVGLGGAGKTSLVRAFLQSHSEEPPKVTDGIDIVKWRVPLDQPNDFLEFSVWDFAGQSVYYHTHQFFLAKKAVYVLAWNIRLGAEHAGLDFWLSSICCHAPSAPIFVVGTHSDQVARIDLRQDDFKRRYPQIAGFFNVSTLTGANVSELIESIIKTTLALPYMDEQIPQAWLTFENFIGKCNEDILEYKQVEEIADKAGIFDPSEVLQAVQFLHDLGSLQYFPSEHLKNYVVINPQWIVNVMACIVSIKDSPVKDGRLFHTDISVIWNAYASALHPWILKLTEAFDLTFPVPDQNMNLVPCLLPEEEPEYTWVDINNEPEMKELKIVYTFNYLPAGLFNRAQVRLFQFSDKSTIWRYGSLLVKNNHRAVIIRTDDRHIVIKIQGIRPDNVLFLIHEVFEALVNESFFGVTYDIAFPCPDCLESRTNDPWQFSSSLINRAVELKSPSIQCHRFFHVASVTDLQALIPPDSKSNYDLHLEYSVRDLKSYKQNIAVDIIYLYPPDHVPTQKEIELKVDPRRIKDDLTKRNLTIWTPESMKDFKIENHYLLIKAAGLVLFGISTELSDNPENENLRAAFETIKDIIRRPIIPIIFGSDSKWKESDIGIALSDALYVNMQNPKRYDSRIIELVDLIEQSRGGDKQNRVLRDQPTDVFISYCWLNSHDAANKGTKTTAASLGWGDPRSLKEYLESRKLSVWMDITRLGKSGVIQDIVHGLKNTKVVIACVSNEYTQSEICRNEFLFAKNTLRLPMILAVFGNGDDWRLTEVGMCGQTCPQVNFQFENPTAFEDTFNCVQIRLPRRPLSADVTPTVVTTPKTEEKTTAAYQELFELTQRKFLRLTNSFAETMNTRPYPRLFAMDFMGEKEKSAQELARIELAASMNQGQQSNSDDNGRDLEAERARDEAARREQEEYDARKAEENENEDPKEKEQRICIRALCENEENWHAAGSAFEITERLFVQNSAAYLTRIMLLLKQSDLALEILNTEEGETELHRITEMAKSADGQVKDAYSYLRRSVMDCDTEEKYCGLKQCLLPSGKVLWLCEEHRNQPRIVLVTGSVTGSFNQSQVEEKSEIIKALAKLNERIGNNEIAAPANKVPPPSSTRRLSTEKPVHGRRHSHRHSRHDVSTSNSENPNILKIDEAMIEVEEEEMIRTNSNGPQENQPNTEDDLAINSKDCSIM